MARKFESVSCSPEHGVRALRECVMNTAATDVELDLTALSEFKGESFGGN